MVTPPDLARYPILVVDDEADNLDAFRFNFKRVFRVLVASSGDEGLKVLQAEDVAVIVTDQRMPRMTGLEFLKAARALRPDAVPIIITAYTDVDVLIEAINLGHVHRYITKPWDAKEVKGVLAQAIEMFHLRRENARLGAQLAEYAGYLSREMHGAFDFGQIVGVNLVVGLGHARDTQFEIGVRGVHPHAVENPSLEIEGPVLLGRGPERQLQTFFALLQVSKVLFFRAYPPTQHERQQRRHAHGEQ